MEENKTPETPVEEKEVKPKPKKKSKWEEKYNEEHGIKPQTIKKDVRDIIEITSKENLDSRGKRMTAKERRVMIEKLTREMKEAAKMLEFEHAAFLRDKIKELSEEG